MLCIWNACEKIFLDAGIHGLYTHGLVHLHSSSIQGQWCSERIRRAKTVKEWRLLFYKKSKPVDRRFRGFIQTANLQNTSAFWCI